MATNNVLVNNLCGWPLYFKRSTGMGDIEIPANAKGFPMLSFEEVLTQIQLGNKMFTGSDGMGNHARIQIVNDEQRKALFGVEGLDVDAPAVVDLESVKALLAIRSKAKFNEQLNRMVATNAEKKMLLELADKAGAEEAESWKVDALRELAKTAGV